MRPECIISAVTTTPAVDEHHEGYLQGPQLKTSPDAITIFYSENTTHLILTSLPSVIHPLPPSVMMTLGVCI